MCYSVEVGSVRALSTSLTADSHRTLKISAYDTKHHVVFSMLSAQVLCGDIRKANN